MGHWDLPESLSREKSYISREYLVECRGKLLRVTRFIQNDHPGRTSLLFEHDRTIAFNV